MSARLPGLDDVDWDAARADGEGPEIARLLAEVCRGLPAGPEQEGPYICVGHT